MNNNRTTELIRLSLDQWQSFVDSRSDSMIFHDRQWIELLRDQYRFGIHVYGIQREQQIRSAIPFLETTTLRGSRKLIALPFSDYLQVLDSDPRDTAELCQLMRVALGEQYQSMVIRSAAPISGVENASPQVRHELSTTGAIEEICASFEKNVKRNLRQSFENELQFELRTDVAAINAFYELHLRTRRKLGIPVQPASFLRRFPDQLFRHGLGFVGVVSKDHTPIAAGIFLTYNSRLMFKYAASHPAALEFRPNDHLVYHAIKAATEQGYRWFDFGISGRQHLGLRRFKRKWGTTESDVYYNYITGPVKSSSQTTTAERFASMAIRNGPMAVCRGLGEVFYKYSQ